MTGHFFPPFPAPSTIQRFTPPFFFLHFIVGNSILKVETTKKPECHRFTGLHPAVLFYKIPSSSLRIELSIERRLRLRRFTLINVSVLPGFYVVECSAFPNFLEAKRNGGHRSNRIIDSVTQRFHNSIEALTGLQGREINLPRRIHVKTCYLLCRVIFHVGHGTVPCF